METPEHLFVYGTLRRDADGPPGAVREAGGRVTVPVVQGDKK